MTLNQNKWVILEQEKLENKVKSEFYKLDKNHQVLRYLKNTYIFQIRFDGESTSSFCYPNFKHLKNIETYFDKYNVYNQTNQNEQIINIIKNYLDKHEKNSTFWVGNPDDHTYFLCSEKQPIVIAILEFDKKIENLIDTTFLLNYKVEWSNYWNEVTYDEIGRRAAASSNKILYNMINDLHIISSTPYEGSECKGHILVTTTSPDVELLENVHINEHKRIRKLLETSNENFLLLIDSFNYKAYGYKICGKGNKDEKKDIHIGLHIYFEGWFSWACEINGFQMFYFENLQARLPSKSDEDINIFETTLEEVFNNEKKDIQLLSSFVIAAKNQKHGTMLVVLDEENAKLEAQRLEQSSTLIAPKIITPSLFMRLSGVDGAIITDTNGTCYTFGAILDGSAVKGDPGRGARYNSALRYLQLQEEKGKACLIVVVSEDGYTSIESNRK